MQFCCSKSRPIVRHQLLALQLQACSAQEIWFQGSVQESFHISRPKEYWVLVGHIVELHVYCIALIRDASPHQNGSYFDESWNFNFYMVSKCSILFTDFRTVFVFVLRPFLLLSVNFLDFNGNFNGKMAKNRFSAIKSGRNALQPSS